MVKGENRAFSKQYLFVTVALVTFLAGFWGCNYARMKDQESVRPYEIALPEMPPDTIPAIGGLQPLIGIDPAALENPVPYSQESVDQGRQKYGYYCIMCHGHRADGNGTVGQSFNPLPTDLSVDFIQQQTDGELFFAISLGVNRHPPLAYTVIEQDRWDIVNYIRFLGKQAGKG